MGQRAQLSLRSLGDAKIPSPGGGSIPVLCFCFIPLKIKKGGNQTNKDSVVLLLGVHSGFLSIQSCQQRASDSTLLSTATALFAVYLFLGQGD